MSAGGGQFVRLMIAPGRANRSRPGSQRHADIKAGVADDDAGLRRRTGVGDGGESPCRMRLAWMTVRGLQRHEARVDPMTFKAMLQAPVGLAGGYCQQPAL